MRNVILILAAVLTACGSSPATTTVAAITYSDLTGTWASPCSSGTTGSNFTQYVIASGSITITDYTYSAPGCSTSVSGAYSYSGTIDAETGSDTSNEGIKKFTYKPTSASTVLSAQSDVDSANLHSYCGKTNWVLNQPNDVTSSAACSKKDGHAVDAQVYSIYRIINGVLVIGAQTSLPNSTTLDPNHDGSTSDKRYDHFSSTEYSKQ